MLWLTLVEIDKRLLFNVSRSYCSITLPIFFNTFTIIQLFEKKNLIIYSDFALTYTKKIIFVNKRLKAVFSTFIYLCKNEIFFC